MVQETKVKAASSESTPLTKNPISAKDCAGTNLDTTSHIDTDILPDVTVAAGPSGSTEDLPDVTASGSLPPASFDSHYDEPGAPEGLSIGDLPSNLRTYAGDLDFRRDRYDEADLRFENQAPMSLPTRQRYRPGPGDFMMSASPSGRQSSYQFPPRSHFLREHAAPSTNQSGRGRTDQSGRGRTAYPEVFELQISIFREVLSLTLFNEFIPEITKMLRLAMREERVDVQGVHKNLHDFGVMLTFHVRPYNYMDERMVTQVRNQMLKLAWEWRSYYDSDTYETLYFFLETCEVNLCRITQKEPRNASGRNNSMHGGSFDEYRQKKPSKQPKNHRSRQNLVKKEYEAVKELLGKYLIPDKTYLRGKKVAFIQVKCPTALRKNATFISSIVEDSSVKITRATVPLSRKKEGQLKGFLVYLETETEDCVRHIIEELFTQEYKDAGIKCKYGVFNKKSEDSNSAPAPKATEV